MQIDLDIAVLIKLHLDPKGYIYPRGTDMAEDTATDANERAASRDVENFMTD